MPTATIDGTELAFEVIGDHGPPWVATVGGRFSKDTHGVRELAAAGLFMGWPALAPTLLEFARR